MPGTGTFPSRRRGRRQGAHPTWLIAPALLAVSVTCGPRQRAASAPEAAGQISPLPRVIQIADDSVTLEGGWYPTAEADVASHVPNQVRTTCARATRRCREEVTTVRDGASPSTESFDYRVEEWTKAKLVAVRKDGSHEVQIRIALTGQAASKTLTTGKTRNAVETRWRLE
jgi:hypothetical protein